MGYEVDYDVIAARIAAQWGSTSEIAWDGMNGASYARREGVAFIRPRVEHGDTPRQSIGANVARFRHFATLVIEVYRPAGTGRETGLQWCDTLVAAFTGYESNGVHFGVFNKPSVLDDGSDGKFHKWTVLAPYYREELT